jgi:hypothetical protein
MNRSARRNNETFSIREAVVREQADQAARGCVRDVRDGQHAAVGSRDAQRSGGGLSRHTGRHLGAAVQARIPAAAHLSRLVARSS